jgi:uncharacterized protein
VVDAAHVLSPVTKADLETKFANLEAKSSIQLVVATVPTLNGQEIEPYANDLFRYWKLGQANKNNGVLLLVAPKEHRVRIEVGYGLEGTLTDAISKIIIANAATPRFKAGDFDGGVTRASDDIITTLTTDSADWRGNPDLRAHPAHATSDGDSMLPVAIFFVILIIFVFLNWRSRRTGGAWIVPMSTGGWSSGGGSGGGGDSGFSGGGGSSGGGGASGDW